MAILRRVEPVNWSNNFPNSRYDKENDSNSNDVDIDVDIDGESIPLPIRVDIDSDEYIELSSVIPAYLPYSTL